MDLTDLCQDFSTNTNLNNLSKPFSYTDHYISYDHCGELSTSPCLGEYNCCYYTCLSSRTNLVCFEDNFASNSFDPWTTDQQCQYLCNNTGSRDPDETKLLTCDGNCSSENCRVKDCQKDNSGETGALCLFSSNKSDFYLNILGYCQENNLNYDTI